MQMFLDYIGSIITFGVFFLSTLSLQENIVDMMGFYGRENSIQADVVSIARLVEYDFSKMGFGASQPYIKTGSDSSTVTFYGDFDNDTSVDSIRYYMSALDTLTGNPDDFFVYRQVNTATAGLVMGGATVFRLQYYTAADSLVTVADMATLAGVNSVRKVTVKIVLEGPNPLDDQYATVVWERKFCPAGLGI